MNRYIGGILLVSGTTIGAGDAGLARRDRLCGILAFGFALFIYWAYMTFTALLTLEVNLWMRDRQANMITMAKLTLGKWGRALAWVAYLFLLYALTTAYLAGCGPIIIDLVQGLTGYTLPKWSGGLPLLLLFGYFIYPRHPLCGLSKPHIDDWLSGGLCGHGDIGLAACRS